MKLRIAIVLVTALASLAGCIVVPAYGPGYYGGGGYRHYDRDRYHYRGD
ncbi:MAG: hypothetical protein JWN94_1314 [Betaproteobacteria bacterium]|jgi:hypothetical protein|nr:hypothetical protein [Betaproteobacteria bacterium]